MSESDSNRLPTNITSFRFIRTKPGDIFSDTDCDALISECGETLKEVYLQRCKELSDRSLQNLESLALEVIDLSSCDNFSTDSFNSFLTSQLHSLKEVRLRKCEFVTEESILHLIASSSLVSLIDVSFCENIYLESLVKKLLQLELHRSVHNKLTIITLSFDEYTAAVETTTITPVLKSALDTLAKQGITITQNLYKLYSEKDNIVSHEESTYY